jgi:hypothetical protein
MDGRTGDVVPEKVVLLLENGFAVWGFRIFFVVILRTGDSRGEEQQRVTTDSGLVAPTRPPLTGIECQVWW